jgi:anti-anti-sigma regulatory factor
MLVYITGTENQKRIENAIYEIQMEYTLSIGEPIKSNSINLLQEVKSTLCKNKDITTLLIDLSVITNDDDDIIKAIKTLRFYNNNCRFIIVATEREIGDTLLSELVNMGIYNIVTDEDDMISKITHYTLNEATYKEASIFQIKEIDEEPTPKKKFGKSKTKGEKLTKKFTESKSKFIVKPLKQKILISIIGSQSRIGVTHTSISLAFSLMKKGYRVAVVELNNNDDFKHLENCYENNVYSNDITKFIKIYQIDFYPNVELDTFNRIQGLNYDYIIIDNGDIENCNIAEHNRADVKLVCFGSKAWEQHLLAEIFELGEDITQNYRFITICDEKIKDEIIEELKPNKVYFPKHNPEPFTEDEILIESIEGYLYEEEAPKKKGLFGLFNK